MSRNPTTFKDPCEPSHTSRRSKCENMTDEEETPVLNEARGVIDTAMEEIIMQDAGSVVVRRTIQIDEPTVENTAETPTVESTAEQIVENTAEQIDENTTETPTVENSAEEIDENTAEEIDENTAETPTVENTVEETPTVENTVEMSEAANMVEETPTVAANTTVVTPTVEENEPSGVHGPH